MPTVRYFAAAREAAGTTVEDLPGETLGALVATMRAAHGERLAVVLGRCSLLVDGRTLRTPGDDAAGLAPDDVVDVLPPFAGG